MFREKTLIFTLCVIALLVFSVAAAQAAPPRQEGDGTSAGDSLNLDDDGDVVDEDETGHQNLGTIMSGRKDADEEECVDDGTGNCDDVDDDTDDCVDDGTGNCDDVDDGTDDDVDDGTDDCVDDGTGNCDTENPDGVLKQHPVAAAMAEYFEVPYEEVMGLHLDGYGFGVITKAYFFADELDMEPAELLEAAHGTGWGNILKENGIHPGNGKKDRDETDAPTEADAAGQDLKDKGKADKEFRQQDNNPADLAGPDGSKGHDKDKKDGNNGRGNGNGNGNGHDNGNGHGNGKGGGKHK